MENIENLNEKLLAIGSTRTLLEDLEDLVSELSRDKITEHMAIQTIHWMSAYYVSKEKLEEKLKGK